MSILLFGMLILSSIAGTIWNIDKKKQSKLFFLLLFCLFVLTIISRQYGYFSYSDLSSYIWRFSNNDNVYFGNAYAMLCSVIRSVFGVNINAYLATIAILTLGISVIAIKIWGSDDKPVYYNSFILLFVVYWGVSFSSEVIRSGLAIVLSLLAIACAKKKRIFLTIIFMVFSIAFHWTEIFIIPVVIMMLIGKDKTESSKSTSFFYFWIAILFVLDIIDFSSLISRGLNAILQILVSHTSQIEHYLHYLNPRPREGVFSFISLQYVYYRLLAVLLVYIFKRSKSSVVLLYSYFIGLSLYTIMSDFGVVTRMQWIFAVPSVFLIYDYIKSDEANINNKKIIIPFLAIIQAVMSVRYLGYYL